jgi:hypothetical protein
VRRSTNPIRPPANDRDRVYPCADCGTLRSKNEGGTTFTVCDKCWDKWHELQKRKGGGER